MEAISCLPEGGTLLAAHRGTDRASSHPENSLSGLEALVARGVPMAEIDVARTRDGVHILFHDDWWDEDSDGRGAVADTSWSDAQTFSLRDSRGRITSSKPVRLEDYLAAAKDRIYLEIDFKRSADYKTVIAAIVSADMAEDVVLIAYSGGQARAMRRFTRDMAISVPLADVETVAPPVLAWLDDRVTDPDIPTVVRLSARQSERGRNRDLLRVGEIAVSDNALKEPPYPGVTDMAAYRSCLDN